MASSKGNKCAGLSAKELFVGGIIGGAIGAVTALLLAPKSGEEFRKDLNLMNAVDLGVGKVKQLTSTLISKESEPYS
ncbi:YtxH domain-containing protein [Sporolactobacillus sp. THM7-4]|nr:YtxH domain-containing protein [Sporolactobacillus sp. THM7-4]